MGDLLESNPQLILMFPRFDIDLGFGEKRVYEVCAQHSVSVTLFILLCNIYTFDAYTPDNELISKISINELVSYLSKSHTYYLDSRLKHIANHLQKIVSACDTIGIALSNFFAEYEKEVRKHFKFEETKVFPYILKLSEGKETDYKIETYEKHHTNIQDKLSDLTNLIVKYLPPEVMRDERILVWFDLVQFSKDIEKHTVVEEKVLIPYVKLMEAGNENI